MLTLQALVYLVPTEKSMNKMGTIVLSEWIDRLEAGQLIPVPKEEIKPLLELLPSVFPNSKGTVIAGAGTALPLVGVVQ